LGSGDRFSDSFNDHVSHPPFVSRVIIISMRVLDGKFPDCGLNLRAWQVLSFPWAMAALLIIILSSPVNKIPIDMGLAQM
jgi:hypothetical protein